ncbi:MAG: PEP-CTERM sorting domain-containing protein [Cyanobacteriota bacterium]
MRRSIRPFWLIWPAPSTILATATAALAAARRRWRPPKKP